MKKAELIEAISDRSGRSRAAVDDVLRALSHTVSTQLEEGGEVTLPGIGKFGTKARGARLARNPRTGERVEVPAKTVITFKTTKRLADKIA
ncbi:MAG: HU family DNA-binding protein [Pseudomonadota bacterium]